MLGPGPGPAPTPALTLPPLRELDKSLGGSESDHGRLSIHHSSASSGKPRSQSSDPHLHQHFHQQRTQHTQQSYGQQQQQQQQQHREPGYPSHDQISRYSSSAGSLPDLYMSSPSAPPSTATSSSHSRVDSIPTMDYLQNNSHHSHLHQRASTGTGLGSNAPTRPDSNAANQHPHQQQQQQQQSSQQAQSTTTLATARGSSVDGSEPSSNGKASLTTNTTTTAASTSGNTCAAGSEQGRNSSKRAAQNRAAQRAFRQRKDLYVRELERKAELLAAAENQLMALAARNQELEALFAAQQQPSSSSSPLPSPLPQHQDGMASGLAGPARGEREWDRERDWVRERPFDSNGGGGPYDHFHSSSSAAASSRPAMGRHSSAQHLRQAYNASSPTLSIGTVKHLSLNNSKFSTPLHHQQQRPESDQEIEMHAAGGHRPHRHLHRHPSESSLNLSRTASFATPGLEGKHLQQPQPQDMDDYPRSHNFRGSVDSRAEMASPSSSSNRSPLSISSTPYPSSSSGAHDGSSSHHYPSSPLSPTHERMPLYTPRENQRSGPMSSPPTGVHGDPAFGPSSSNYDLNKKRPSDGGAVVSTWSTSAGSPSDLYRNAQDPSHAQHPHPYHNHHAVKKQASWSSLSEQRRLQHSVKKQPSWGSISEHRHHWRAETAESPEMPSSSLAGGAFNSNGSGGGNNAPALPRIPPQFSQRPPPPQQQHSFEREREREYPSSPAASGSGSGPVPFPYSPTAPQHSRQSSELYYSNGGGNGSSGSVHSRMHRDASHGPSDMDIVQEGVPSGGNGNGHYSGRSVGGGFEVDHSYDDGRASP